LKGAEDYMMPIIKPKALKRGDAIGIVVPAGPVNRERIDRALSRVRERGFQTKTYGDIYRSHGYLAGDDATRADELMAAFADPETSVVWCARGGYGVMRLLDRIDFDIIRRNPKVFIGFSDITALHVAIQQRTGLISFHGPNLQDGFGKHDDILRPNEDALWRAVLADNRAANEYPYPFDLQGTGQATLKPVHSGTGTGRLTGGNLAVLAGMMGTPYEMETSGRILLLEDIGERLYRIDRYLSQLRLAGKFNTVAGVLLGRFSNDEGDQTEDQSEIAALCTEFFADLGVPVLAGFPAGHETFNLTLPIGALIKLDADAGTVTLLESCVAER
jgi:muramoyltetrapeptide carboxypeptidase